MAESNGILNPELLAQVDTLMKRIAERQRNNLDATLDIKKAQELLNGDMTTYSKLLSKAEQAMLSLSKRITGIGRLTDELESGAALWVKHLNEVSGEAGAVNEAFLRMAKRVADVTEEEELQKAALTNVKALLKENTKQGGYFAAKSREIREQEKKILLEITHQVNQKEDLAKSQIRLKTLEQDIAKASKDQSAEGVKNLQVKTKELEIEQEKVEALKKAVEFSAEMTREASKNLDIKEREAAALEEISKLSEDIRSTTEKSGGVGGFLKGAGDIKSMFKGMLQASPEELEKKKASFGALKAAGEAGQLGKASGLAKVAGGLGEGIAGSLTKLNPYVAIATAIVEAIGMAMDYIKKQDTFKKKFTNAFVEMAGPVFDGDAMSKESDKFNTAIFDVKNNQKLGVTADEWGAMFKAMTSTGVSLQSIIKTYGTVDNAQNSLRSSTLKLGMSLEEGGKVEAEWAASQRSSADQMASDFDALAQGAKQAGMRGEYFTNVVNQSILALGNYGKFVATASAAMAGFTKSGANTQKAAEGAEKGLMGLFTGDFQKKFTLMQLAGTGKGGVNIDKLWGEETASKQKQLAGMKGSERTPEYQLLERQISQMEDVAKMQDKGMRGAAMAAWGQYLTSSAGKIVNGVLKSMSSYDKNQSYTQNAAVLMQTGQIPQEVYEAIANEEALSNKHMEHISKALTGNSGEGLKAFLRSDRYLSILKKGSSASLDDRKELTGAIESLGADEDTKASLLNMMENPAALSKLMEGFKSSGTIDKKEVTGAAVDSVMDPNNRLGTEQVKNTEKQISAMTDLVKRSKINDDALQWMTASSGPMEVAAKFLSMIYDVTASILEGLSFLPGFNRVPTATEERMNQDKKSSNKDLKDLANNQEIAKTATKYGLPLLFAGLGGALGSVVPVLGTAVGASLGATLGYALSGPVVKEIGKSQDASYEQNRAEITGVPYKQGKYAGGIVGYAGGTPSASPFTSNHPGGTDTINAKLTPGEMVLTMGQQTRLWNILNGYNPTLLNMSESTRSPENANSYNVSIYVSGVTGSEVATEIDKRLKDLSYKGTAAA